MRILVTRIRGRGLRKTRYDIWMASLGPSEKLLRDIQSEKISWAEFKRRYRSELFHSGSGDQHNSLIKNHGQKFTLRLLQKLAQRNPITLMCHCEQDQQKCHRHILKEILNGKI